MNKRQLIETASKKLQLPVKQTEKLLNTFIETGIEGLKNDNRLSIRGIFVATVKKKNKRKGVNPQTLQTMIIPEHYAITIKAGEDLKRAVTLSKKEKKHKNKK